MVATLAEGPQDRNDEDRESFGEAVREAVSDELESALADYRDQSEQSDTDHDRHDDQGEEGSQHAEASDSDQEARDDGDDSTGAGEQADDDTAASEEPAGTDAVSEGPLSQLPEPLRAAATEVWESEGQEIAEALVESAVNALFSSRAQSFVRRRADDVLQIALDHALAPIDDLQQRRQLYRDALQTLRPIVRDLVNASFDEEDRRAFQRHGKAAVPHLVRGELDEVAAELGQALRKAAPRSEQVFADHSDELIQLMQDMSTAYLTEGADSIQDEIEEKGEEVRQHLADALEQLQDRLEETQAQLQEGLESGIASNRMGQRRQGFPPSGRPPSGQPPFGQPPSGMPPSGQPPNGQPPSGVHPAARASRGGS